MEEQDVKAYVIRPIVRNKFSGQSSYSKSSTVIAGPQLDMSGTYKTGLSKADEEYFEKELNLTKGTLNKRNADFWGDLEVRLKNDKLTLFSLVTPMDELKLRMLKEHDLVAETEHHIQGSPGAQFYIYDPEAASKIEDAKMEFEFAAMEAFHNTTIEERRGLLRIYGKVGVDNMSETMVKTELFKELKKDFKEFVRLTTAKDTPIRALVKALIEKEIIKKKGNYFYNGEDLIGSSTDETVSYLSDMKNQAIKLALEGKLKPKKITK